MPLNATALSTAIKDKINAAHGSDPQKVAAGAQALADAIAQAVVDHIQANAVVNVTSVSGVTAGGAVSGPGTGTIS